MHALSDAGSAWPSSPRLCGSEGQDLLHFLEVNDKAVPKSTLSLHFEVAARRRTPIHGDVRVSRCSMRRAARKSTSAFPDSPKAIVGARKRFQLELGVITVVPAG